MTSIPRDSDDDRDEVAVDALTEVILRSFTGSPTSIGPFDHSTLAWQVDGVGPRVKVRLSGLEVPANGSRIVAPEHSTGYPLTATSGAAHKSLGHVQITVDESTCIETPIDRAFILLHDFILNQLNDPPETYWSGAGPDHLWIVPLNGQIVARAIFRYRVGWLPDLWVTFDLKFGLAVDATGLVAVNKEATGVAEWPTWFGFSLLNSIQQLKDANARATTRANELLEGLVAIIKSWVVLDHGKRLRSVEVGTREGNPYLSYVQCAAPRDVHFPREGGVVFP